MDFLPGLLRVIRKIQWLWLIGLIGIFSHRKIFMLFFLFGILNLFDPLFWTSLFQIYGNFYSAIKYKGNLPSFENYTTKNEYILPFCGKWTVINGGVDKDLSHSWEIFSQRYAFDFFILDDEGNSYNGDPVKLENYYCYGKDIIATADGVVVKVCDKYKNSRVDGKKGYCDAADLRGNHIIIQHENNEYSVIAHLAPGSVIVKIGDKVKQGDIIAKCGNSGNTSEPHVYFQIQKDKNFFLSASLPIGFKNIEASLKINYEAVDKRSIKGNLRERDGLTYIGRGVEAANKSFCD
jgi:hypothetical protein